MSPADELAATQYTLDELRAAVEEAEAAGTYVMAHAYNDRSVRNCLQSGVRSIEHGNLIDEETARLIARSGAYLVPTLVTYEALSEEGDAYGVPENVIRKIDEARELGIRALRYAYEAGVKIASGSDLLGPLQDRKARELEIKTEVMSPMESLVSATKTNAELFGMEERDRYRREGQARGPARGRGKPAGRHRHPPEPRQPQTDHERRQDDKERARSCVRAFQQVSNCNEEAIQGLTADG